MRARAVSRGFSSGGVPKASRNRIQGEMRMPNEAWIERQTRTPEARRRYEEERLILWATEAICEAMEDCGLDRAEIADKLGTSRANVRQLLSGSRNMTLRSLAGLAHACGMRAEVVLEELALEQHGSPPTPPESAVAPG